MTDKLILLLLVPLFLFLCQIVYFFLFLDLFAQFLLGWQQRQIFGSKHLLVPFQH